MVGMRIRTGLSVPTSMSHYHLNLNWINPKRLLLLLYIKVGWSGHLLYYLFASFNSTHIFNSPSFSSPIVFFVCLIFYFFGELSYQFFIKFRYKKKFKLKIYFVVLRIQLTNPKSKRGLGKSVKQRCKMRKTVRVAEKGNDPDNPTTHTNESIDQS